MLRCWTNVVIVLSFMAAATIDGISIAAAVQDLD
jgi:hypothetical protein